MKAIHVTDVHVSSRPPRSRRDSFLEEIENKLLAVTEIAKEENADVIFITGDLFNDKVGRFIPHQVTRIVLTWINDLAPAVVIMIPGNHDQEFHRLRSLDKHPYSVIAEHPRVFSLEAPGTTLTLGGDPNLFIMGAPYTPDINNPDKFQLVMREKPDDTVGVVLAHAALIPDDTVFIIENNEPPHLHVGQVAPYTVAELTLCGDLHYGPLPDIVVDGKHFVNFGALTRISVDSIYEPSVAVIDIKARDDIKVERRVVPHEPHETAFRSEEHERKKKVNQAVAQFVEELKDRIINFEALTKQELFQTTQALVQNDEQAALVKQFLEEAFEELGIAV
jgi:DNA repair exonuclease SbcCD nuclease subunit